MTIETSSNHSMPEIVEEFDPNARIVLTLGDSAAMLSAVPDESVKLIVTSPPYNLGKEYEKSTTIDAYAEDMSRVIDQSVRVLAEGGSICWQVGSYVENGELLPLDILFYPIFRRHGLKLRNRIIWHFEHGLHANKRFSGRYETLMWFTKGDSYTFNLDDVRIPSKYPGKTNWRPGPSYGKPTGNPKGINPSDFWKALQDDWSSAVWKIPNVKANHPEKTVHPCQFPIELAERCVLALSDPGDWVMDPFSGVGTTVVASVRNSRRAFGCEKETAYLEITKQRISDFYAGNLRYRELGKPVHQPTGREKVARIPEEWLAQGAAKN